MKAGLWNGSLGAAVSPLAYQLCRHATQMPWKAEMGVIVRFWNLSWQDEWI